MKYFAPILFLAISLSGCDTGPDLAKICNESPELCNDFHEDSWCKRERANMIVARNRLKLADKDVNKYRLLLGYEDYAKCMSHASKIEHIKLKNKKRSRVDNVVKAKQKIKEMSDETKNSMHPELLFYHWSRYLNEAALENFLKLEGMPALENPESQFNLATYYIKRDPDKTLSLLFRSLELLKADQTVNKEVFKSLTTIFTDQNEYKQAYIWLKVLNLYDPEDTSISEKTLEKYSLGYDLDAKFLNQVAAATLEKIEAGTFEAPKH